MTKGWSLLREFHLIGALLLALATSPALAAEKSHGLSTFGALKYPLDFKKFDYTNADAPKGGTLSMIGTSSVITFNSLNAFILKGDPAQGLQYLFDTLMVRAFDEPDAVYGLVAHSVTLADDRTSATFYLRPEAKFADGSPVTADDVVFSFNTLKKEAHPVISQQLRDVVGAEKIDDHTVRYRFEGEQVRDLPLIVAGLPILSKAYYTENKFNETTLKPPLGSGPYKVGDLKAGRFISYKRRQDYWARDLNVNVGRHNFDELRYEYFRDRTAEFQGLLAGQYDLREEFTSKVWATQYDVEKVRDGRILKLTLPNDEPSGAQGFFINLRREKFKDRRVREALGLAFDFEWTNKNQFYGLYERTHSFFENSEMKASGKPSAEELALLEPYRDKLPAEVFGNPFEAPKSNGSGQDRNLLRRASKLLKEAGWTSKGGKRVNGKGEVFTLEFLMFSPTFERVIAPFVKNLKILGIDASMRLVDPSQFQARLERFDFDVTTRRYIMPNTPGVILRNYWGSKAANLTGANNLSGIADPVVDALIEKVIEAKSRKDLITATRAIDRVLRAGHYWVPHWYKAAHHIAVWNKFSWPETKPRFNRGIIETWWYDKDKAAKLQTTN